MFNILFLSFITSVIISSVNGCSIPDDCGSYHFIDWMGIQFSVSTHEVCTECDWFGTCWASKCEEDNYDIFRTGKINLIKNYNYDYGRCWSGDDGCSNPWYPSSEVYEDLFHEVCQIHDWCYSNSDKSQTFCDQSFYANMVQKCQMEYPEYETAAKLATCVSTAYAWYEAVVAEGNTHPRWSGNDCFGSGDRKEIYMNDHSGVQHCLSYGQHDNDNTNVGVNEVQLYWVPSSTKLCTKFSFDNNSGKFMTYYEDNDGGMEWDGSPLGSGWEIGSGERRCKVDKNSGGDPFQIINSKICTMHSSPCCMEWDADHYNNGWGEFDTSGYQSKFDCNGNGDPVYSALF